MLAHLVLLQRRFSFEEKDPLSFFNSISLKLKNNYVELSLWENGLRWHVLLQDVLISLTALALAGESRQSVRSSAAEEMYDTAILPNPPTLRNLHVPRYIREAPFSAFALRSALCIGNGLEARYTPPRRETASSHRQVPQRFSFSLPLTHSLTLLALCPSLLAVFPIYRYTVRNT